MDRWGKRPVRHFSDVAISTDGWRHGTHGLVLFEFADGRGSERSANPTRIETDESGDRSGCPGNAIGRHIFDERDSIINKLANATLR